MSNQIVNAAGQLMGPGAPSVILPGMNGASLKATFPSGMGVTANDSPTIDSGVQAFTTKWVGRNLCNVFGVGGVPFGLQSSGTIGNNGALSGLTAFNTTYTLIYLYFPLGALFPNSQIGWYATVMSSTTAGTVYNNMYLGGQPTRPTTLVPIVATGPGAYTQLTAAGVLGPNWNVPGGTLGLNGSMEYKLLWTNNNSAGQKQLSPVYQGNVGGAGFTQATTVVSHETILVMRCRGSQTEQVCFNGTTSAVPTYLTANSAKDQIAGCNMQINTATDWMVVESYEIDVFSSGTLDFPAPAVIIPSSSVILPQGAQDAGITSNLFYIQPQAQDVAGWSGGTFNNTANAALYAGLYYKPNPPFTTAAVVNNALAGRANVLGLIYDGQSTVMSLCTQRQNSTAGNLPYIDASKPFYAEWCFSLSDNHPDHWPAMWLMPQRQNNSNPGVSYVEIDVLEGYGGQNIVLHNNLPMQGPLQSNLDWNYSGTYPSGSFVATTSNNDQSGIDWGCAMDYTQFNTVGVWWNPSTNICQYYVNGRKTWSKDCTAYASHMNTDFYYMIVSSQSHTALQLHYTTNVLWLSAWQ